MGLQRIVFGLFIIALLGQAVCRGATNQANVLQTSSRNQWDEYESKGHMCIAQSPTCRDGYEDLMIAIQFGEHEKALRLANEMVNSSGPSEFKLWAKGVQNRFDLMGKPVQMRFEALDGRDVDLNKMQGRVVLIDFWGRGCTPCVAALTELQAAYKKYHTQGFEVIGVAFDDNKAALLSFVREKGLEWPQYFDGKSGEYNKYGREFGIAAIPHMLLIDKRGRLRLDILVPRHPVETSIDRLMAEK